MEPELKKLKTALEKVGYSRIEIRKKSFLFGLEIEAWFYKDEPRQNGNPALWEILKELGISWGCGSGGINSHFHQVYLPDIGLPIKWNFHETE